MTSERTAAAGAHLCECFYRFEILFDILCSQPVFRKIDDSREQFSKWYYFVISPSEDKRYYHYNKPVVILMDRRNFSACDIFLGAFKGLNNVKLMGQPSGGGSGCYQVYWLRNSKIRIHLSSMASFQPNGKLYDGNGIRPDIIVEPAPTDFIGETDIVLDTAIRSLISKNNSLHL